MSEGFIYFIDSQFLSHFLVGNLLDLRFKRCFATNLKRHREKWCNVQLLVDEQKEQMRDLCFFSSTNIAVITSRENHQFRGINSQLY